MAHIAHIKVLHGQAGDNELALYKPATLTLDQHRPADSHPNLAHVGGCALRKQGRGWRSFWSMAVAPGAVLASRQERISICLFAFAPLIYLFGEPAMKQAHNVKHAGQQFFHFTPASSSSSSGFPAFLQRISSASLRTLPQAAETPVTYKHKPRRAYTRPANVILDLMEYFFLTDGLAPRIEGHLTLPKNRCMDFTGLPVA